MGAGQQVPLWSALPELKQRVLLIVGEHDARYSELAERMHVLLPVSEVAVVPLAGHTVHVDAPNIFGELVKSMLDDQEVQMTARHARLRFVKRSDHLPGVSNTFYRSSCSALF